MDAVHRPDSRRRPGARSECGNDFRGVFLLAIYSAGLAVPFLLTAIGINRFLRFLPAFPAPSAHGGSIERRIAAVRRRADFPEPADLAIG